MTPQRVVIALDKFKGSATAQDATAALARGLQEGAAAVRHPLDVVLAPIADGGDGTVAAALTAGFAPFGVEVTGPLGTRVLARCALRMPADTAKAQEPVAAVIELAETSGLKHVPGPDAATHARASTRGVADAMRALVDHARTQAPHRPVRVMVGLGGSASTDAGLGLLQGLGARLLTAAGAPIGPGLAGAAALATVDLAPVRALLAGVDVEVATDVEAPLLGPTGAAHVFGPQKGLPRTQLDEADAVLARAARLIGAHSSRPGFDCTETPGAGAAGGAGFGLLTAGATVRSGAELVLELIGFEHTLRGADVMAVGEGSLDAQTLQGKGPAVAARWAHRAGVSEVIAVAGRVDLSPGQLAGAGISRALPLTGRAGSPEQSMTETLALLTELGRDLGRRPGKH